MSKQGDQRLKLFYMKELFEEYTDDDHGLHLAELRSMLKKMMRLEKEPDRKSMRNDFDVLNGYFELHGLGEIVPESNEDYTEWVYKYLGSREFEMGELKLLIDSVASSKFLSEAKTKELIKKFEKYCSVYQRKQLQRQVIVPNRIKSMNTQIHYNTSNIHGAIADNKQISFRYFHHDTAKKKVYSKKGQKFVVSPWMMVYSDENYYLVAFDSDKQEMRHFRVDRMEGVIQLETDREGADAYSQIDKENYTTYNFGMYQGERKYVTMRFTNDMVDSVLDRFGNNVDINPLKDKRHFETTVLVSVSDQFFGWVFGLGNKVQIVRPDDVVEKMKAQLGKITERYK